MMRFSSSFAVVPVVALMLAAPRPAHADVTRVWLLRAGSAERGTHLWIEKDQPTDNTGKLHGIIAGRPIPVTPSVPTDKLIFDASGNLSGGTVKLKARTFTDLGGSSLDLKIAEGAILTVDAGGGLTLQKANVTIGLPFGKNNSSQPSLTLNDDIVFHPNGDIHIEVTSGALTGGANKIGLAGFSLSSVGTVHVLWDHKPGSGNDSFSCELGDVKVAVPLPGVLAQDDARHAGGIELSASKLTVDGDGNVSADGDLSLDSPTGIQVPLAKPMDFVLTVHHFLCTLQGSKVTPKELTADLTLPASFTTDDEDNPDRVTIHGIAVNSTGDLYANETETFSCRWNGFRLNAQSGFTIDLSETQGLGGDGTTEKWEGIKFAQAKIAFSDKIKTDDGSDKPVEIELTTALIDEHGFSGTADVANVGKTKIEDFQATLSRVKLTIEQNEVQESALEGSLTGLPGWDGTLGLKGEIAASGALGLEVTTDTPIRLPGMHAGLQIDNAKFDKDAQQNLSLIASGKIVIDDDVETVGGAIFTFTNVGFDKNGDFVGDRDVTFMMDMPQPLHKEFGPLTIDVSQVGIGKKHKDSDAADAARRWFVCVSGQVALSDLPVDLGGGFEGLYVWESADHSSIPDVEVGKVTFNLGIDNVLSLDGYVAQGTAKLPVSGDPVVVKDKNGKPLKYVTGELQLGLPILGSAGFDADLKMMVAPHAWYVMGGLVMPSPIPLGQSGLALKGFFAGIGHNVAPYPTGAHGLPTVNYDLLPDPDNTTGHSEYLLITAGTRLQTMAPTPLTPGFWADMGLVITVDPLSIALAGNAFLMDPYTDSGIPADPKKYSRVLSGEIKVATDPTLTFSAHFASDLNFPTRENWILRETGTMDLTLNKNGISFLAGGPISEDHANHTVSIQNPNQLWLKIPKVATLAPLNGALTFDANPTRNGTPVSFLDSPNGLTAKLQAAASWTQPFEKKGSADVGITVDYDASGTIDLEAYLGLTAGISGAQTTLRPAQIPLLSSDLVLQAPNAYFYGDVWAKASVSKASLKAHWWKFDAGVQLDLTGYLEGQALLYLGAGPTFGGDIKFEGDITGSVDISFPFHDITLPVSAHEALEVNL